MESGSPDNAEQAALRDAPIVSMEPQSGSSRPGLEDGSHFLLHDAGCGGGREAPADRPWACPCGRSYATVVGTSLTDMAAAIVALPEDLTEATVARPELCLWQVGPLAIYFAPFGWVNRAAQVTLIGITPGRSQAVSAYHEARRGLRAGQPHDEVRRRATLVASFSGPLRKNLVSILDRIALNEALEIDTCAALFGERADLLQSTSVISHMVLINGKDYGGGTPSIEKTPVLWACAEWMLAQNVLRENRSLVIPLGRAVGRVVELLVERGALEPRRCLHGFPHPSGANGHRSREFDRHRSEIERTVREWFATRPAP